MNAQGVHTVGRSSGRGVFSTIVLYHRDTYGFFNRSCITCIMSDGVRLALWIMTYILVNIVLVILLLTDHIGIIPYLILTIASLAILFIPILRIGGAKAEVKDGNLRIRAPMVDLDIPLNSITAVECRDSFRPGIRMFGYGGFKRGSGDFKNAEFPHYTFAGDTRIGKFILIRYGKDRVAVFNSKDEGYTESLYTAITAGADVSAKVSYDVDNASYTRFKRNMAIVVCAITITIIALVAIVMNTGHVDVHLEDDAVVIDATMMNRTIGYTEIESVELREEFDVGRRVGGFASNKVSTGNFHNDEFGNYKLAIHNGMRPVIVVHCTDGGVVVFDAGSPDGTRTMFEDLQNRIAPVDARTASLRPSSSGTWCFCPHLSIS